MKSKVFITKLFYLCTLDTQKATGRRDPVCLSVKLLLKVKESRRHTQNVLLLTVDCSSSLGKLYFTSYISILQLHHCVILLVYGTFSSLSS